jgi:hypothetical protein
MKNKWKKIKIIAFIMAIGLLIIGCSIYEDLPISTVDHELGNDGFYQFYTNDPANYGYAYWEIFPNTNNSDIYEIECKKISGKDTYPYGMIFGASDYENFYFVNIAIAKGSYQIWKRVDGEYQSIQDWTSSSSVITGYNKLNTIKVEKNGYYYSISINDNEVASLRNISLFGEMVGFYTSIGAEEDEYFPNTPVEVKFRQK